MADSEGEGGEEEAKEHVEMAGKKDRREGSSAAPSTSAFRSVAQISTVITNKFSTRNEVRKREG